MHSDVILISRATAALMGFLEDNQEAQDKTKVSYVLGTESSRSPTCSLGIIVLLYSATVCDRCYHLYQVPRSESICEGIQKARI